MPRHFLHLLLLLLAAAPRVHGQMPVAVLDSSLDRSPWTAHWIAYPDDDGRIFGVYHFRRSFDLDSAPDEFVVHVSADNRYRLYVNGIFVGDGPARGDLASWRFETFDLAPLLVPGKNTVAAVVWNFAAERPMAQHTYRTAFLLQGNRSAERVIDTDESWRVEKNRGYSPVPVRREALGWVYIVVGPGEEVNGVEYPWGWELPDFEDASWDSAMVVRTAVQHWGTNYGEIEGWRLTPRTIPAMEEREQRLDRIRRSSVAVGEGFLRGWEPVEIPPQTTASLLIDNAVLTTAYPELVLSGGRGARVEVTYAEALFDSTGRKGHRDEIEGKSIRGIRDVFHPDGGRDRLFRPLWWRTYRYIQLDIETAAEPLTLEDYRGIFNAYPFRERARFASSNANLEGIWEAGWRTARLCAGETYFDCPYYEQLQYVGDTRIQALISLYVAGDDLLMRNAIEEFGRSRIASGLTQSRYPSHLPQIIPPYSLFWVVMVHDYWMHREDPAFVESFLTGIRGVIDWYAALLDERGLVGPAPWWNYVDWAFPRGVPPGADEGGSSIISLQLVYALDRANELAAAFGRMDDAAHYARLARLVRSAVNQTCWDEERLLLADTPEKESFSQHANVLAVLTAAIPDPMSKDVMSRSLSDTALVPAGYYFRFYVDEAVRVAGLADTYLETLDPWWEMLALGLTTFTENPEPTRSDAHAWSSGPNYQFLATVCGIRPSAAGFSSVRIEPALGPLEWVNGAVPHPAGEISVAFRRAGDNGLRGEVHLPPGVSGMLIWAGRELALESGRTPINLD